MGSLYLLDERFSSTNSFIYGKMTDHPCFYYLQREDHPRRSSPRISILGVNYLLQTIRRKVKQSDVH